MIHGSTFSGIGGFDLAAEWMGWSNAFHVELDPFNRRVLNYHFPDSKSYVDIKKTDFAPWRGTIDVLSGGFPCQPFSNAGKGEGTEDDRHLWPEMHRAIRQIKPKYFVGENVSGLLSWNDGLVLKGILVDLEDEGYEVEVFVLPAMAVGAPHRRDRVWIIAHSRQERNNGLERQLGKPAEAGQGRTHNAEAGKQTAPDPDGDRQPRSRWPERLIDNQALGGRKKHRAFNDGRWPTESPVYRGDDGISERLDGVTFREWARQSIAAYGNAIVPQLAYRVFQAIQVWESGKIPAAL